jgi:hypothetical protein
VPRNPKVAAALYDTRFAETKGSGVRVMREMCERVRGRFPSQSTGQWRISGPDGHPNSPFCGHHATDPHDDGQQVKGLEGGIDHSKLPFLFKTSPGATH